jgi:hypothetical protein
MCAKGFKGSRLHMLEWIKSDKFIQQFNDMLIPTGALIEKDAWHRPTKYDPREARLGYDVPTSFQGAIDWGLLVDWWLVHKGVANIPNWDFAAESVIDGVPGLVLVEAKAHASELKREGKRLYEKATRKANHKQIEKAISEARSDLNRIIPGVRISIDNCYQLSNRISFAWKLASFGIPIVLIYLGFYEDRYFKDYFRDETDWRTRVSQYTATVLPAGFINKRIYCGPSFFQTITTARPVQIISARTGFTCGD